MNQVEFENICGKCRLPVTVVKVVRKAYSLVRRSKCCDAALMARRKE